MLANFGVMAGKAGRGSGEVRSGEGGDEDGVFEEGVLWQVLGEVVEEGIESAISAL